MLGPAATATQCCGIRHSAFWPPVLTPSGVPPLARQAFAEFVGTAALLCAVIGSGIMAERLSAGNMGVALLANTLATVFALYVLIECWARSAARTSIRW
jgi:hypothetical protein